MPKVVFEHALLHGHLGTGVQVLHFATAASARVQAKVRAARANTLRGLVVNLGDHAFFKAAFAAVNLRRHLFERQGPLNEHHFAIGLAGNALGLDVHGVDAVVTGQQQTVGQLHGGQSGGGRVFSLLQVFCFLGSHSV